MDRHQYVKVARILAEILDRRFTIPGTNVRFGLDPLIGLIPGFGDAVAGLIGSFILLLGAQLGIPKIVLFRMTLNIALNGMLGSIPIAGDLFSVWFKSNVRNVRLLERQALAIRPSTAGDWAFVIGLLLMIVAVFATVLVAVVWAIKAIWQHVG